MTTQEIQKMIIDACENAAREELSMIAANSKLAQAEREMNHTSSDVTFKVNQKKFREGKTAVNVYKTKKK
tara:strand:- start:782 stop:991 length:210 start_codon:yes stop_codon:yes gene_type:complete